MLAETQRLAMLQTIGIDVYRLRSADARTHAMARGIVAAGPVVVVVCPRAADAGPALLRRQLPRALGLADERIRWLDTQAVGVPHDAAAYIAIGTEAARALGAQLSTMQQNNCVMAATAEPAALLRDAAAKRALWQTLKPVARSLREIG